MPSIEDVLLEKLTEDSYAIWLEAWRGVVDEVLAREVLSRIGTFQISAGNDF